MPTDTIDAPRGCSSEALPTRRHGERDVRWWCRHRAPGATQWEVWDLDRAFRSVVDALTEAEKLRQRGIHFRIASLHIDTSTPAGIFVYTMMSALAEFERRTLSQRTREGLAAARKRGEREIETPATPSLDNSWPVDPTPFGRWILPLLTLSSPRAASTSNWASGADNCY